MTSVPLPLRSNIAHFEYAEEEFSLPWFLSRVFAQTLHLLVFPVYDNGLAFSTI